MTNFYKLYSEYIDKIMNPRKKGIITNISAPDKLKGAEINSIFIDEATDFTYDLKKKPQKLAIDHQRYEVFLAWFMDKFFSLKTEEELERERIEAYYKGSIWAGGTYKGQPWPQPSQPIYSTSVIPGPPGPIPQFSTSVINPIYSSYIKNLKKP